MDRFEDIQPLEQIIMGQELCNEKIRQLEREIHHLNQQILLKQNEVDTLRASSNQQHQQLLQMDAELQQWRRMKGMLPVRILRKIYRVFRPIKQEADVSDEVSATEIPREETCNLKPCLDSTKPIVPYEICVSIIIPTYQGERDLTRLLGMISRQIGIQTIECIVVDSGSTDGTVSVAQKFGCKIIQITQEQFSHSYARNLGAENASGEYLLFMTQDAFPTDAYWLYNLVTPIIQGRVAAVSPMEQERRSGDLKYKVDNWFHVRYLGVAEADRICELPTESDFNSLRRNAQLADIACVIKKDTFMKYKYQGDFAEDLRLGLQLIRDGEKIALLSTTKVIHSHARPAEYYIKRNLVDVKTIKELLPDYPACLYSADELKEKIARDDMAMLRFIMYLQHEDREIEDIDMLSSFLQEVATMEFRGDTPLMHYNDKVEEILSSLGVTEIIDKCHAESVSLPGEFVSYLCDALLPYIREKHMIVSQELKEEIQETMYKCFCAYTGVHLAEYLIHHQGEDNLLIDTIENLMKGV